MSSSCKVMLYKDRPEWKDVTPVEQKETSHPVVQIAYSEKFKDTYDYFRAVLESGEKSERVLELTRDATDLNPANYTVWQYRREVLKHLDKDLNEELQYSREIIEDNAKNYQVWHHRKVIVQWLNDPSKEKRLTEIMLQQDAKNYHVWQHRQWIVKEFNLFDGELDFTDKLLIEDLRNNSAWNHRFMVVSNTDDENQTLVKSELKYTMKAIAKITNNEAPWNYLRGLLDKLGGIIHLEVEEFCNELFSEGKRSPHLLGFLIDLWREKMEKDKELVPELLPKCESLCDDLATKHDTIRVRYWEYLSRCITKEFK